MGALSEYNLMLAKQECILLEQKMARSWDPGTGEVFCTRWVHLGVRRLEPQLVDREPRPCALLLERSSRKLLHCRRRLCRPGYPIGGGQLP